jgi:MFS transporter, PAT family, beta-lactamase induction signal transducer AmpG
MPRSESPEPRSPEPRSPERPPELRKKLSWIAVLYFAEGFPFGIVYDVWPVYFRRQGMDLAAIGLLALLRLPYTLKPAWAPLVDRFGSRQIWILGAQLVLSVAAVATGLFDAKTAGWWLWGTLLLFTLASATQDIAIDAYAVDVATPRDSGPINGVRVAAYRAALVACGGLLLALADVPSLGWTGVWWVAGLICVVMAFACFRSPRVARERTSGPAFGAPLAVGSRGIPRHLLAARLGLLCLAVGVIVVGWSQGWPLLWKTLAVLSGTLFVVSLLNPTVLSWVFSPRMLPVFAFGLLFKVGDNALGQMVRPYWVDRGMSNTQIAFVSNTLGVGLTVAGALLGGWFVARRGIFQALLWLGLAQLVSNFGYVAVAGLNLPDEALYAASMLESFTQGLGTAAFLSFLMNLCSRENAATQYAFLSAAFALSRDVAGALSGFGVEAVGYPTYFLLTAFLAVPGLLLLPLVRSRIREEPLQ